MAAKKEKISKTHFYVAGPIWIHTLKEWRERDYKHVRALPGEYTVKLLVNDKELTGKAVVMQDHWYIKQW